MNICKKSLNNVIVILITLLLLFSIFSSSVFASGGKSQTDAENIELQMSGKVPSAIIHGTTRTWSNEDVTEYDYYKFTTSNYRGSKYSITVTHNGGSEEDLETNYYEENDGMNLYGRVIAPYQTRNICDEINLGRNITHYIWLTLYIGNGSKENADYTIKITEHLKNPVKQKISSIKSKKRKACIKYIRDGYADKYQIAYKKSGTTKWKFKTTTNNSYAISQLKSKKKYNIKVRGQRNCYNKCINGSWSSVKTIKIK